MSSPISGFTAIPNPQMLAFMPIQSYLMMYFAGSAWQFGKRKISAMSNEQFNALDMKTLLEQHTIELKNVIPTLEKSLNDVTPLIAVLIEQYGDFIKAAIAAIPQALQNIVGGGGEFSNVPTSSGSGLGPAQTASFLHYFKELADATKVNIPKTGGAGPSTIPGMTVAQAQTQAKVKQEQFDAAQLKKAQAAVLLARSLAEAGYKPPTGPIAPFQGNKPKAGQSQILERNRLVAEIAAKAAWLKVNPQATAGRTKVQQVASRMAEFQQLLVNLLDRYRF